MLSQYEMCRKTHSLILIKWLLSLICLVFVTTMFLVNKHDHPYCFWNGIVINSMTGGNHVINSTQCAEATCDKKICDYLYDPNVEYITIELMSRSKVPSYPRLIGIDLLWFLIIILLFSIVVIDIYDAYCVLFPRQTEYAYD